MNKLLSFLVVCFFAALPTVLATTYGVAVVQTLSVNVRNLMDMAAEDAAATIMAPGDTVDFRFFAETDQTTSLFSALSLSDFCNDTQNSVWGVVGYTWSVNAVAGSRILTAFNTPVISHSAASVELSDKSNFPTFNRVLGPDDSQARAVAAVVNKYGWKRVGVLATGDIYGQKLTEAFVQQCAVYGVTIVQARSFLKGAVKDMEAALASMRQDDVRIIAMFVASQDSGPLLELIVNTGMHLPPYQWLGVYGNIPQQIFPLGALGVDVYHDLTTARFLDMKTRLEARPGFTAVVTANYARLYDAAMLMARSLAALSAIDKACAAHTTLPAGAPSDSCSFMPSASSKRFLLNKLIRLQQFDGVSGRIALDSKGDNTGAYKIVNQVSQPSTFSANATTGFTGQNATYLVSVGLVDINLQVSSTSAVVWPGHATLVPTDRRGVRIGDKVKNEPDSSIYVLAFGTVTIGAWVSLILVEQAVASRVRVTTKATLGWLALSSLACAIGAWSALAIGATSVSLPDLPSEQSTIYYKAGYLFSIPLLLFPFMFVSFWFVIRGVRTRAGAKINPTTDASTLNPSALGQTANSANSSGTSSHSHSSQNKALPASEELYMRGLFRRMFLDRLDRNLLIGAIIFVAGMGGSVYLAVWSLHVPCKYTVSPGTTIGAVINCFILGYLALYFLFHFRVTQMRFVGAFVVSGAVLGMLAITLQGLELTYTGQAMAAETNVTVVRLIAAIVVAIISFLFMGLNVTRLKLSRDMLDNYLLNTQRKVKTLEKELVQQRETITQQQSIIDLIHLLRPLVRKDHFKLKSMEETMEARIALYGPVQPRGSAVKYAVPEKERNTMSPTPNSQNPLLGPAAGDTRASILRSPTLSNSLVRADSPARAARSTLPHANSGRDSPLQLRSLASSNEPPARTLPDPTLPEILANPISYEIFKDAVLTHHNMENMAFHADVQQYKREPESNRLAAARSIAETFIEQRAPYCINISGTLRQSILSKIPSATDDSPPVRLFETAEGEVLRLLVLNDFPRFRESEAYATCKSVLYTTQYLKDMRFVERDARFEAPNDSQALASLRLEPEREKERVDSPAPGDGETGASVGLPLVAPSSPKADAMVSIPETVVEIRVTGEPETA